MTRRLHSGSSEQLQVGLGTAGGAHRGFVFEAVSQCAVFGGGTQLTVLGESPPCPSLWVAVYNFGGHFSPFFSE